jgi:hypothetical protein
LNITFQEYNENLKDSKRYQRASTQKHRKNIAKHIVEKDLKQRTKAISILISSIRLKQELGKLDNEYMNKTTNDIKKILDHINECYDDLKFFIDDI